MRKKQLLIVSMALIALLSCAGCSSVPKEKTIKEDLENYSESELLEKGEKIDEIVIDKRETDKEKNEDTVWCTVTTQDSKISSEKEMVLSYHKYDKEGWILEGVKVEDSDAWEITPLKGIAEKDIPKTLDGKVIKVDGNEWEISEKEVDEISIDKQETELNKKTDKVTMSITLKGKVQKAKGKLVVNYKFNKKWEEDKVLETGDFTSEPIPEKALNITEDELIGKLVEEKIAYGDDSSMAQEITIAKEEISDFKIEKQESKVKGTEESIYCSCTLNKKNVVLGLQMVFRYSYGKQWEFKDVEITTETQSFDILGTWSGENIKPGSEDKVVFDITKVEGNKIEAKYSYTPTGDGEAGSYYAVGEIDTKTLNINLTAGDWIVKPEKDAFQKQDIKAAINVDMGIIEGYGNHGYVFRVEKQ